MLVFMANLSSEVSIFLKTEDADKCNFLAIIELIFILQGLVWTLILVARWCFSLEIHMSIISYI